MKSLFLQELKQQDQPLKTFKKTLKDGYEYLAEEFNSGENIELIVKRQSWFIDQLLIVAWQQFVDSEDYSLVAVGGYGRSELLLASDIDLMILEKRWANKNSKQQVSSFLTFYGTLGLKLVTASGREGMSI